MQYFTEQAYSHREALEKIRQKYGDQAKILTHRTIRIGGFLGLFAREGVEITGYVANEIPKKKLVDLEEEKKKILATVPVTPKVPDITLKEVLKEVQAIKEKLEIPPSRKLDGHPTIQRIEELLRENDFTESYIRRLIEWVKKEFSLEQLENFEVVQDRVIEWIGDSIRIYQEKDRGTPIVFVIVGPTGVGKTTTIAKLAALYGISSARPNKVRMITIDNYRIAAKEQIETYGNIMGIPVACAETYTDLKKFLALYQDVDRIFIDTIGKSPRDFVKLAEMKELLEAASGRATVHLAISATTKAADMFEIMSQFEPFGYSSVIITKLDETSRVGSIISALAERGKAVSYFTDGQRVPQDIELATPVRLLMRLQSFRVQREKLERKFNRPSEDLYVGKE
ncbi:MAG: flagellar biosynthesis protein FlhF [Spirochaetes bacterium]|nr:flagellar biosynthesis protein FlhF [Spirochaetota bacterium]